MQPQLQRKLSENVKDNTKKKKLRKKTPSKMEKSNLSEFADWYSKTWAEEPGRLQSMGSLRVGHD